MNQPDISVLIPAFNEEKLIGGVIDSVRLSFAEIAPLNYEIIVCDNNSTDRTTDISRKKGVVVVTDPHNQIARARNTAAKTAKGKWLIFLDADTVLSPALLKSTVAALESGHVCGGGSVLEFDSKSFALFPYLILKTWNRISALFGLAAGSYLFCYREAWIETGGFDESVYAGEEIIFSKKLKLWGRQRGMKFKVFTNAPILTSARKMEWYSQWELLGTAFRMAWPGAINNREKCGIWYNRPQSPSAGKKCPGEYPDSESD